MKSNKELIAAVRTWLVAGGMEIRQPDELLNSGSRVPVMALLADRLEAADAEIAELKRLIAARERGLDPKCFANWGRLNDSNDIKLITALEEIARLRGLIVRAWELAREPMVGFGRDLMGDEHWRQIREIYKEEKGEK